MIKLQNLVPSVYYDQSRDFQYIGRLYDIVLNSVKTNVDMIYSVPDCSQSGSKLVELLALTLGFQAKHKYNVKQLSAVCTIFQTLLKKKGTLQAVSLLGNTILYAEGLQDNFYCEIKDDSRLEMYVPQGLSDLNLLKDVLPYILPAGIQVSIIRAKYITTESVTVLAAQHVVNTHKTTGTKSSEIYTDDKINSTDIGTAGTLSNSVILTGGDGNGTSEENN